MTYFKYIITILTYARIFFRVNLWFIVLIVFLSSCNINKHLKENEYLLSKNTVKYNGTAIDNAELEAFIRQNQNRKILKLVRFNLWLYNQVDQQKMLKKRRRGT